MDREQLVDIWERHVAAEFEHRDAGAAMATMSEHPRVVIVPALAGGVGRQRVRQFYASLMLPSIPDDFSDEPISRSIDPVAMRLVEESVFRFTHDIEIPWILPGIPPTHQSLVIPTVTVVAFEGDKISGESVYWDQAALLVQVGAIEPHGLPISDDTEGRAVLAPGDIVLNRSYTAARGES